MSELERHDHLRLVAEPVVPPGLFDVVGSWVEFDDRGGLTLLGVRSFRLSRSSALAKRTFDLAGAALGLLALAPLIALTALLIRGGGAGPVFFRQQRVGRRGREFEMVKFRTMVVGAEQQQAGLAALTETDGLFKIADDSRITRVGLWLRRASLDELPQLWNVLRGDMSLVGPRPLVPEEDRRVEGVGRRRLDLRPGMTGPWQLHGATRPPLREMVAMDCLYAANRTMWSDLKILVRTVPHVLGGRGL